MWKLEINNEKHYKGTINIQKPLGHDRMVQNELKKLRRVLEHLQNAPMQAFFGQICKKTVVFGGDGKNSAQARQRKESEWKVIVSLQVH